MNQQDNIIVSEFDKMALKIIRKNVSRFIRESAKRFDKKGLLLEIGPQDYRDTKKYFKKMDIQTLDIDPTTKTTFVGDVTKKNEL